MNNPRVLIIEDEIAARDRLTAMLHTIEPGLNVVAAIGSVKESIEWFEKNPSPDIAFVDIQLSDDHSFSIFRRVRVTCPIIFTTAYDKYLLESLEFNSIDYLLKPISPDKLRRAIDKVRVLERHFAEANMQKLLSFVSGNEVARERLLVRKGTDYLALPITDVAYIFSEHKISFVRDRTGNQYMLDKNLTELETELDSRTFFRINRKYLATAHSISRFSSEAGKIRVHLKPETKEEVHVSKENAPAFRKWIAT